VCYLNAAWRIGNSPEKKDSVCRLESMPRMNEVGEVVGSNPAVAIFSLLNGEYLIMSYSISEDWGTLLKIRRKVHKILENKYKDRYVLLTINISPEINPNIIIEYMVKDINSIMSSEKAYYRETLSTKSLNQERFDYILVSDARKRTKITF